MEYLFASDEYDTALNAQGYQNRFDNWSYAAIFSQTLYSDFSRDSNYLSQDARICGKYNEGMGIFLSGPGINGPYSNGAENIAVIPGTNQPVTTRTLRPVFGLGSACDTGANAQFFNWNSDSNYVLNGYSDVFSVKKIPINPCDTYSVTIVVGQSVDDTLVVEATGDTVLKAHTPSLLASSATIIKRHSAKTGFWYPAPLKLYDGLGEDTIAEGCPGMLMQFVRFFNLGQPDSINIVYEGAAEYGVDYDSLPEWVYFAPGQDTVSFVITPTEDLTTEAIENLVLRLMPPGVYNCPVDTTEVELWISDRPGLYASIPDTFHFDPCATEDVVIGPDSIFGLEEVSYLWSTGATTRYDTVAPVNNANYSLTVYDACMYDSLVFTTVLRIAPDPVFSMIGSGDTITCSDSLHPIGFEITENYYPQFHYAWSTGDTDSIAFVNPLYDGSYEYTVTVYRPCMPDSFVLSLPLTVANDPVDIDLDDLPPNRCPGFAHLLNPSLSGGYPPYSYFWGTGENTSSITVDPMETTQYVLSVTDSCGVDTFTHSVVVNVPEYDPLRILGQDSIMGKCTEVLVNIRRGDYVGRGGTGTLDSEADYFFSWDNWNTLNASFRKLIQSDTTLLLQMTDSCGNDTATFPVRVDVFDGPFLSLNMGDTMHVCLGENYRINAGAEGGVEPLRYRWSTGSNDPELTALANQPKKSFSITVTDDCLDEVSEEVTVYATRPTAGFDYFGDGYSPKTYTFENASRDAVSYRWYFGDGGESQEEHPTYSYLELKDWEVKLVAIDSFGCTDAHTDTLEVPLHLFVPNAFTPNGDGQNEVWQPLGYGYTEIQCTIFNRWGEVIFSTGKHSDALPPWDGTLNGHVLPAGIYTYVIRVWPLTENVKEVRGEVHVMR